MVLLFSHSGVKEYREGNVIALFQHSSLIETWNRKKKKKIECKMQRVSVSFFVYFSHLLICPGLKYKLKIYTLHSLFIFVARSFCDPVIWLRMSELQRSPPPSAQQRCRHCAYYGKRPDSDHCVSLGMSPHAATVWLKSLFFRSL